MAVLLSWIATAASAASELHDSIRQIYDFHPRLSDIRVRQEKVEQIRQFWEKVAAEPDRYAPALRAELGDFSNPSAFLYDGAKLLMSLSEDAVNRRVALRAFARTDLSHMAYDEYFQIVHWMAVQGEDTTDAALRILERADFGVFVIQHALRLAQDYCLVYLLLPTDPRYWVAPMIERLRIENDETAQKSVLTALWYAQTDDADAAIRTFADNPAKPASTRQKAEQLLRLARDAVHSPDIPRTDADITGLRQRRQQRMHSVSDEALYDFELLTRQIMQKRG